MTSNLVEMEKAHNLLCIKHIAMFCIGFPCDFTVYQMNWMNLWCGNVWE